MLQRFVTNALAGTGLCLALAATPAAADKALLVGIDVYQEDQLSFEIPDASAHDVANMKRLLTGTLGFAEADIRVLKNQEATKAAILGGIRDWLVGGTQPGERTYFFYVGHGYYQPDQNGDETDGQDETIVPHDAKIDPNSAAGVVNMISDDELGEAFRPLSDRRAIAVFDSCHSGTVTRAIASERRHNPAGRTPNLKKFRSITVEPAAAAQKAETEPFDRQEVGAGLTVWTAVTSSQVALIDTTAAPDYHGVFTAAFVKGQETRAADKNSNGDISNAELLAYVRSESDAYCNQNPEQCEMGLTPMLEPDLAYGDTASGDDIVSADPDPGPSSGSATIDGPPADSDLDANDVLDFFVAGNDAGVSLEQIPPSPVKVGARNIRFRVTSPVDGQLILINLTDDGELIQLFPNQHVRDQGRAGAILAGSPITVPDAYYGIRFDATAPTSGTLIALVALDPIDWPRVVGQERMAPIPLKKAVTDYLPKLAAALGKPRNAGDPNANTNDVSWSVATLRYEIRR